MCLAMEWLYVTLPPGWVWSIVMSMSVCLSVLKTAQLNFTKFFLHVPCGCCSFLLWWHCDTLCTSSFTDDIVFSFQGASGPESSVTFRRRLRGGSTSWMSDICIVCLSSSKYGTEDKVCYLQLPCLSLLLEPGGGNEANARWTEWVASGGDWVGAESWHKSSSGGATW